MFSDFLPDNVSVGHLLTEEEAVRRDTVLQGEGEDLCPFVVKDLSEAISPDGMYLQLICKIDVKIGEMSGDKLFHRFRAVQVHGILPAHQIPGRKKRIKTKEVVTVKVTNEDMIYPAKADVVTSHLHLGALSAVY